MGGYSTKEGQAKAQKHSLETRREQTAAHAFQVGVQVLEYRRAGLSLRATAELLNMGAIPPERGGRWHAQTVKRVLARLAAEGE